jgi:hypothetical protein
VNRAIVTKCVILAKELPQERKNPGAVPFFKVGTGVIISPFDRIRTRLLEA